MPVVCARFVDGPYAGLVRQVEPGADGAAPALVTVPVRDPGLGTKAVAYERFTTTAADGCVRYRVAPLP